jgi:hypothetical protein
MGRTLQFKGNGKSQSDFLIVQAIEGGYRIYAASEPTKQYFVDGNLDNPACSCDAFAEDTARGLTCEHYQAVREQVQQEDATIQAERAAIQTEGQASQPKRRKRTAPSSPTMMTLKRSVSPDGRIDSLSVEFSCAVEQVTTSDIALRAGNMLKLQSEIARSFLGGSKQPNGNGHSRETNSANVAIPAKMLHVGTSNGRYGPRLYIAFQANGYSLKLFGTAKQLAQTVCGAGFQFAEHDIAQGVYLNLPCKVITKPGRDPRYTDIERVLPANGSGAGQRGSS